MAGEQGGLTVTPSTGEDKFPSTDCIDLASRAFHGGHAAATFECREKLVRWMLENSFASGHGDTMDDLLRELAWQIAERIARTGKSAPFDPYRET
jgi:hypothetical protein